MTKPNCFKIILDMKIFISVYLYLCPDYCYAQKNFQKMQLRLGHFVQAIYVAIYILNFFESLKRHIKSSIIKLIKFNDVNA